MLKGLQKKQIEYYKEGDIEKVGVLRFLISAIKNKEIELRPKGEDLTDEMVFRILKKQIKMRVDAIGEAEKANRNDLTTKETKEKIFLEEILEEFFPNG